MAVLDPVGGSRPVSQPHPFDSDGIFGWSTPAGRQPREQAVCCQNCRWRRTGNWDAICDPCADTIRAARRRDGALLEARR